MFCASCLDFAVVPPDEPPRNPRVSSFCKSCFQQLSSLPFLEKETVTILSAANPSKTVVFVHGGGGCRLTFLPHAEELIRQGPYKCILLDLPGHGVKMDDILTLESSIHTILEVTKEHGGPDWVDRSVPTLEWNS